MGILPLQYLPGQNAESLDLTGFETFDIDGIASGLKPGQKLSIQVHSDGGVTKTIEAIARIDTPYEIQYYRHGGILQFVLRQLLAN
jgi:aconitate hydratase